MIFAAFFLYHGIWHFSKGMTWFSGLMKFVGVPAPSLAAPVIATFEVVAAVASWPVCSVACGAASASR